MDRMTGYPVDLWSRKPKPMEYEDITRKIIGCAYRVYNTMGFGFLESVYEKCLVIELKKAGLKVKTQVCIPVKYAGESVGDFAADRVATGIPVGLLINFGETRAEVKRKVRQLTN